MPEALDSVATGQPFEMKAVTYNMIMECVRAFFRAHNPSPSVSEAPALAPTTAQLNVMGRNDTGATLPAFSVVKLSSPIVNPNNLPYAFRGRPVLSIVTPGSTSDPIGITYEGIPTGSPPGIGSVMIAGMVLGNVLMNSMSDQWAAPIAADSTKLSSGSTGPARILWVSSTAVSTGVYLCVLLLYDGQGTGGGGSLTVQLANGNDSVGGVTTVQLVSSNDSSNNTDAAWSVTTPAGGTANVEIFDANYSVPGIVSVSNQAFKGYKSADAMVSYNTSFSNINQYSVVAESVYAYSGNTLSGAAPPFSAPYGKVIIDDVGWQVSGTGYRYGTLGGEDIDSLFAVSNNSSAPGGPLVSVCAKEFRLPNKAGGFEINSSDPTSSFCFNYIGTSNTVDGARIVTVANPMNASLAVQGTIASLCYPNTSDFNLYEGNLSANGSYEAYGGQTVLQQDVFFGQNNGALWPGNGTGYTKGYTGTGGGGDVFMGGVCVNPSGPQQVALSSSQDISGSIGTWVNVTGMSITATKGVNNPTYRISANVWGSISVESVTPNQTAFVSARILVTEDGGSSVVPNSITQIIDTELICHLAATAPIDIFYTSDYETSVFQLQAVVSCSGGSVTLFEAKIEATGSEGYTRMAVS